MEKQITEAFEKFYAENGAELESDSLHMTFYHILSVAFEAGYCAAKEEDDR